MSPYRRKRSRLTRKQLVMVVVVSLAGCIVLFGLIILAPRLSQSITNISIPRR